MRRTMMAALLGSMGMLIVAACGGGGEPSATPIPAGPTQAPAATPTQAGPPTATPAAGAPTAAPTRPAATPIPALASSPTPPPAAVKRGGVLRQDDPSSIGPVFQVPLRNPALGGANARSSGLIFQTLFQYDLYDNHAFKGILADRWEYSPKADEVTIAIQREAKWSDGKPVTAGDIKFNLDHWAKPPQGYTVGGAARTVGLSIAKIDVVDEKTARITLKGPDVSFVALLADPGAMIRASHQTLEQSAKEPIGSGAYMVKEIQADVKLTSVKNPAYWVRDAQGNALPYVDGVESHLIQDNTRAWTAISVGQVDILVKDRAATLQGKQEEIARRFPNAYVQLNFGGSFGWGFKNTAPYNDPRFMRAMHILTDRLALIELVYRGEGVIDGVGVMPPSFGTEWALPMKEVMSAPGFRYVNKKTGELETDMDKLAAGLSATYEKDPKDIALGKQLLREAGMDPAAGKLPKFSLSVSNRFEEHAVVLAQTLSKMLEVKIPLDVFEEAAAADRYSKGQFEAIVFSLYAGNLEPSQTLIRFTTGNASWLHGFQAPELDALFAQQKAEVDPAKRKEIIWQFQRKIVEAPHMIPGSINRGPTGLAREWVKGHWRVRIVGNSNTLHIDRLWLDRG